MTDMSTQIERVGDLYMSSDFAAKVKHNNASFAVHRAQLKGTQALLANMRRKHVFPLMELPEEVRRLILIMLVRNQCNLQEFKYELPAIAWAGNDQLCSETLLAALQNNVLDQTSFGEMMQNWLATVSFDALQKTGVPCPQNGLGAIRTVDILHYSEPYLDVWKHTTRLLSRLENLRDLLVICYEGTEMFEIASDYGMFGDALGARVRGCNLDLPSLNLPSLRKLTIALRCYRWMDNTEPDFTDRSKRIEDGCKKVAGWLSEEYIARGLRVTVHIQTDIDG
jgi:hypothetical protein